MILKARPLWLGSPMMGALPMPPPIPPDGYGDKDGTWSNRTDGGTYIVAHNRKNNQDCDWQDTYENWQRGGVWNPCDTTQLPGEVRSLVTPSQTAPTAPILNEPPLMPEDKFFTPGNGLPIQTAPAPAPTAPAIPTNPPPTPLPTKPLPPDRPLLILPPPAPVQAPSAPVKAPSSASAPESAPGASGGTSALVAGGIGAAGILTAILIGVFRK